MTSAATEFAPAFREALRAIFEEQITFNRVLGLKLTGIAPDGRVSARLAMKPELVGHFMHNRLHGGAASASLDTLGGLAAMAALAGRHLDEPPEKIEQRFAKLGTIDLRIDYLRPAIGEHFDMTAEVLRLGSRVATTRMELMAADGRLLCAGAAAYIVS